MNKLFNNFGVSNISKYYLVGILFSAIFPLSNWVFFFREYMSIETIGLIDGVAILIGIISEIPTGALGDLLGKKKTIIVGLLTISIACFIIASSSFVISFFIGNSLLFIGYAFISGSLEALSYDSLLENGKEENYAKVSANYGFLTISSLLISMGIGGYIFGIDPRLPWFFMGITSSLATIVSFGMTEPRIDSEKFNLRNYFKQMTKGVKALLNKHLRRVLILIILLSSIVELGQGLIRQSTGAYFGYDGESFGYLLALTTFIATLIVFNLERILKVISEYKFLLLLIFIMACAYSIALISNNVYVGALVCLLLVVSGRVSVPFISIFINHKLESKDRATSISTLALLKQVPYIVTVVFFAQIAEVHSIKYLFLIMVIVLVVFTVLGIFIRNLTKEVI